MSRSESLKERGRPAHNLTEKVGETPTLLEVNGQFPNGRILEADDHDMLEEERRLFYVALTRAKDELYHSYPMMNPKSYTGDIICNPSHFLGDFPGDMVEEWNVGNSDPWSDDEPF